MGFWSCSRMGKGDLVEHDGKSIDLRRREMQTKAQEGREPESTLPSR